MKDAGAIDPRQCYFVDDSAMNIDAAKVKKLAVLYINITFTLHRKLAGLRFISQAMHQNQIMVIFRSKISTIYQMFCLNYGKKHLLH